METKYCQTCGNEIPFNPRKGVKSYNARKYCSAKCSHIGIPRPKVIEHPERVKECEVCGNPIPKEHNRNWNMYAKKRFCSVSCSAKSQSQKVEVVCEYCGKVIERSPSHVRGRKYCGRECKMLANTTLCTCGICGKEFRRHNSNMINRTTGEPYNGTYCSAKCQGIAKRTGNEQNQGRRSPEDLAWKNAVLKRDGYKCQHCGTDRNLEAHHIIEIKERPDLRHELSNGLTLCHDCHYYGVHNGMPNFIHGRYSKQRQNTPS